LNREESIISSILLLRNSTRMKINSTYLFLKADLLDVHLLLESMN
jgi:hypothetical protein